MDCRITSLPIYTRLTVKEDVKSIEGGEKFLGTNPGLYFGYMEACDWKRGNRKGQAIMKYENGDKYDGNLVTYADS
jgi:hypothetical protein